MPDHLRIAVDELQKRMEAGEDFVLSDTRKAEVLAQSDVRLPEAIRVPLDNLDENLSKIPMFGRFRAGSGTRLMLRLKNESGPSSLSFFSSPLAVVRGSIEIT